VKAAAAPIAVAALLACSRLPDYAEPKGELRASGSVDLSDATFYRALTRADFRASEPPAQAVGHEDKLGAATCAVMAAAPGAKFATRPIPAGDGAFEYEATPAGLHYRAQMNRACSWWNPRDIGLPEDYVLEHEQIHFALVEIEARRLNATIAGGKPARADTPQAALEAAQARLDGQMRDALDALLARNTEFDEDTSVSYEPEAQKRWLARVQAELAGGTSD